MEAGALILIVFIALGIVGVIVAAAARGNGTEQASQHWGQQSSVTDLSDMSRSVAPTGRSANPAHRLLAPASAYAPAARQASTGRPALIPAIAALPPAPRTSAADPIVVPTAPPIPSPAPVDPFAVDRFAVDAAWVERSIATTDVHERSLRPTRPPRPSRPSRPEPASRPAVSGGPANAVQ